MAESPDERTAAMVREAAALMGKLFVHRKDRKAVFRPDHTGSWHWTAVEKPYKMEDFLLHLTKTSCLGTYLLAPDSTVKFLAFDLDLSKHSKYLKIYDIDKLLELEAEGHWENATAGTDLDMGEGNLEAALHDPCHGDGYSYRWARTVLMDTIRAVNKAIKAQMELSTLTVVTGGGAHVLVPLPEPAPATEARSAGIEIASSLPHATKRNEIFFDYGAFNEVSIEVFPKQDAIDGQGFGNLIRLPFGWHYEAAIRTYSIDPEAIANPYWEWKKTSSLGSLRTLAASLGVA